MNVILADNLRVDGKIGYRFFGVPLAITDGKLGQAGAGEIIVGRSRFHIFAVGRCRIRDHDQVVDAVAVHVAAGKRRAEPVPYLAIYIVYGCIIVLRMQVFGKFVITIIIPARHMAVNNLNLEIVAYDSAFKHIGDGVDDKAVFAVAVIVTRGDLKKVVGVYNGKVR